MTEWILFLCMINPINQAVKCGVIVSPTQAVCEFKRDELDAVDDIIVATTTCRAHNKESTDDIS